MKFYQSKGCMTWRIAKCKICTKITEVNLQTVSEDFYPILGTDLEIAQPFPRFIYSNLVGFLS